MGRPGLRNHAKFRRLVKLLSKPGNPFPEANARGLLEMLWEVAYENGEEVIGDEIAIELSAGWTGEEGILCNALLDSGGPGHKGFIEPIDDGRFKIHDLFDHAPDYVMNRRDQETERKKLKRCFHCESEYKSKKSHSKFCCDSCRINHFRETDVTHGNGSTRNSNATVTHGNGTPAPAPAPAPALNSSLYPASDEKKSEALPPHSPDRDSVPVGPRVEIPAELQAASRDAFSAWRIEAVVDGKEIDVNLNEDYPIRILLEDLANNSPGSEKLVPKAAEFCKSKAKEFKSVKWAATAVKGVIEDGSMTRERASPKSRSSNSPPLGVSARKAVHHGKI